MNSSHNYKETHLHTPLKLSSTNPIQTTTPRGTWRQNNDLKSVIYTVNIYNTVQYVTLSVLWAIYYYKNTLKKLNTYLCFRKILFSTIVRPPIFNSLRVLKVWRRQLKLFSQNALMNCLIAISFRIAWTFYRRIFNYVTINENIKTLRHNNGTLQ